MLGEITLNSQQNKDLLAVLEFVSYDSAVTDGEFWKKVGEELQRRRMQRGLKSTNAVQTAGGPSYKTVAEIESGAVGQVGSLAQYLRVVDLSIVDLFRAVLRIEAEDHGPDLEFVIRQFKRSGRKGRAAFVQVAELAEEQLDRTPPESRDDRGASRAETNRGESAAAKRRVGK